MVSFVNIIYYRSSTIKLSLAKFLDIDIIVHLEQRGLLKYPTRISFSPPNLLTRETIR
jgi:hypothetical protein